MSRIAFDSDGLVNDGQLWIHGDDKCPPTVWKTDRRPRVTLDRQSSSSEIWHLGGVKFHEGCGLWFGAKFDTRETQTRVETILRVLGDTGIGGERSAGYGIFDLHSEPAEIESEREADRFVTLSPICPRDADELNRLIQGDVGYTLEERSGWIGSTEGNGLRRQQVWMFAEGSVLAGNGRRVGRLVDLKPDRVSTPGLAIRLRMAHKDINNPSRHLFNNPRRARFTSRHQMSFAPEERYVYRRVMPLMPALRRSAMCRRHQSNQPMN